MTFNLVDRAFWQWHKKNCPHGPKELAARTNWMRQAEFQFADRTWKRHATPHMSKTGIHIRYWTVAYSSDDGTRLEG